MGKRDRHVKWKNNLGTYMGTLKKVICKKRCKIKREKEIVMKCLQTKGKKVRHGKWENN